MENGMNGWRYTGLPGLFVDILINVTMISVEASAFNVHVVLDWFRVWQDEN